MGRGAGKNQTHADALRIGAVGMSGLLGNQTWRRADAIELSGFLQKSCQHETITEFPFACKMIELFEEKSEIYGVYALFDGGQLVYVGKTVDLYRRPWQHKNYTDGESKKFDRVFAWRVPKEFLEYIESALVGKFRPKYNGFKNKKSSTFGCFCVRDRLAFENPSKAWEIYLDFEKIGFLSTCGEKLGVKDARALLESLKPVKNKISQAQIERWKKFREQKAFSALAEAACL